MKTILSTLFAVAVFSPHWAAAEVLVKSGDKIAFLGDSITAQGWGQPVGYVRLVIEGLNAIFQEAIKTANKPGINVFTGDGVHMNPQGNQLMATGELQAFGLNPEQIAKAKSAWEPLSAAAERSAWERAESRRARQEKAAKDKPSPEK